MESTTSIHDIENDPDQTSATDTPCSISSIMDFTIDNDTRLLYFHKMYLDPTNYDDLVDVISRIGLMFQMSGVKVIEFFLESVCVSPDINAIFKIHAVNHLMSFSEQEEFVFPEDSEELKVSKTECNSRIRADNASRMERTLGILDTTCAFVCADSTIPTPFKIELFSTMIHHDSCVYKGIEYFKTLINSESLDFCFRYKIITSIANYKSVHESTRNLVQRTLLFSFIDLKTNANMYTVLAAQNLLSKPHEESNDDCDRKAIYSVLTTIATNVSNDQTLRADAADALLSLCKNNDVVEIAKGVIQALSFENVRGRNNQTVYSNLQNVHVTEIEKSALRNIETHLVKTPVIYKPNTSPRAEIDFEYLRGEITKHASAKECIDISDIVCSLNRIELDKTLFGVCHLSLSNILIRVWSYIQIHRERDELMIRLIDELRDMSGTCASGCAFRLANIISGFDGVNLSISFHDQIVANFTARMNKQIRGLERVDSKLYESQKFIDEIKMLFSCSEITPEIRESFQDKVIEELLFVNTTPLCELKHLTVVVRNVMFGVREELYTEFKPYVSDQVFDDATTVAFKKYL
jgi:hypothetical protein